VALFSDTDLKPHDKLFIPNYHFYLPPGQKKAELPLQLEKAFPVII
jgi:hypothetical protein